MARSPKVKPHVERPGPTEFSDPIVRTELQRATVWFGPLLCQIFAVPKWLSRLVSTR